MRANFQRLFLAVHDPALPSLLPLCVTPLPRVVVFVDLLNELIEVALSKFSQLTDGQKMEVATYIIPEVSQRKASRVWASNGQSRASNEV